MNVTASIQNDKNTFNWTTMRKIALGFLFLITTIGFSQKNQIQVSTNEKVIGKSLIDNSIIKGVAYVFPERINETFLDTTTGFLTVQLRGLSKNEKWLNNTGTIVQYDIKNHSVLWHKKIAYATSSLQQFSKTLIYTVGNKSYCLDTMNGNELWEVKNNIYFVDPIDHIGIGYKTKSSSQSSKELEGIDLKSGNLLWKRELNRDYGWNNVLYTNDSTLIVVAAGLHAIDIKTGKGWDYNTITGKKDYTGTVAANAVGVGLALLTGTLVTSSGHNVVRDLVSNVLMDSSYLYFSSKEQLAKINKQTGDLVWTSPFPKDLPSKSTIFMNDSLVFMINHGFAFMGNRQLDFGKPFIAAFDKQTGTQKYLSITNGKDDAILDFQVLDNDIYLVFKNRIAKYSKATGELIIDKEFQNAEFGELKHFIGNKVFITNKQDDFVSLPQSDTTKVFIHTSQGKTLAMDKELNVSETIAYEDLSVYYLRTKDYKFISKDKQTLIVDNDGKRVAEVEATSDSFLIGKTLYDRQDNSFLAIDLKDILKDE